MFHVLRLLGVGVEVGVGVGVGVEVGVGVGVGVEVEVGVEVGVTGAGRKINSCRSGGHLNAAAVKSSTPVAAVNITNVYKRIIAGRRKSPAPNAVSRANTKTLTIKIRIITAPKTATLKLTRHAAAIATTATKPRTATAYFIAGTALTASFKALNGLQFTILCSLSIGWPAIIAGVAGL